MRQTKAEVAQAIDLNPVLVAKMYLGDAALLLQVPGHMHGGLLRYILLGVIPGDFLRAVLVGDLFDALRRADDVNLHALPAYGRFLHNVAPLTCYGNADAVMAWHKRGGLLQLPEGGAA